MDDTARSAGGALGDYLGRSGAERSAADLIRDIISNVQEMVRSEIRLATAEVREEAERSIAGAKKMAVAAVAGLFALGFALWSLAMLLMRVMPDWAATLTVGVALGITAAALFSTARGALRVPKPDKAIESVKENVEWMKDQTK